MNDPEFFTFLEKQQLNSTIFQKLDIPLIHDYLLQSTVRVKPIACSRIQCEHPGRTNVYEQKLYEFVLPVIT
jgi:hypothetical protein